MTHLDSDPDRIRVCDTNADGKGVYGVLTQLRTIDGMHPIAFVSDGGDGGCDIIEVPIVTNGMYQMQLCWGNYGTSPCVASGIFTE
ncbi:hypothetical protein ABT354_12305 [Streptomyces sp. NPDC000594]|uniref:hypothetical protein n=1 Tax=Streptomyces sp. NPDC000594 TaxID=3154261 RepID=UPI003322AF4B